MGVYQTAINSAQNLILSGGHDDHVRFWGIKGNEGKAEEKYNYT